MARTEREYLTQLDEGQVTAQVSVDLDSLSLQESFVEQLIQDKEGNVIGTVELVHGTWYRTVLDTKYIKIT